MSKRTHSRHRRMRPPAHNPPKAGRFGPTRGKQWQELAHRCAAPIALQGWRGAAQADRERLDEEKRLMHKEATMHAELMAQAKDARRDQTRAQAEMAAALARSEATIAEKEQLVPSFASAPAAHTHARTHAHALCCAHPSSVPAFVRVREGVTVCE